jgi:hypothetical protein
MIRDAAGGVGGVGEIGLHDDPRIAAMRGNGPMSLLDLEDLHLSFGGVAYSRPKMAV